MSKLYTAREEKKKSLFGTNQDPKGRAGDSVLFLMHHVQATFAQLATIDHRCHVYDRCAVITDIAQVVHELSIHCFCWDACGLQWSPYFLIPS